MASAFIKLDGFDRLAQEVFWHRQQSKRRRRACDQPDADIRADGDGQGSRRPRQYQPEVSAARRRDHHPRFAKTPRGEITIKKDPIPLVAFPHRSAPASSRRRLRRRARSAAPAAEKPRRGGADLQGQGARPIPSRVCRHLEKRPPRIVCSREGRGVKLTRAATHNGCQSISFMGRACWASTRKRLASRSAS